MAVAVGEAPARVRQAAHAAQVVGEVEAHRARAVHLLYGGAARPVDVARRPVLQQRRQPLRHVPDLGRCGAIDRLGRSQPVPVVAVARGGCAAREADEPIGLVVAVAGAGPRDAVTLPGPRPVGVVGQGQVPGGGGAHLGHQPGQLPRRVDGVGVAAARRAVRPAGGVVGAVVAPAGAAAATPAPGVRGQLVQGVAAVGVLHRPRLHRVVHRQPPALESATLGRQLSDVR